MIVTLRQKLVGGFALAMLANVVVAGMLVSVATKVSKLAASADAGLLATVNTAIAINVITIVALGVISWRLTSTIVDHIARLGAASDDMALGNMDTRIDSLSKDEIGQLAASMKAMASNIQACARAAASIASGDLSVEIKAASDDDVLAKSMMQVVDTLRGLVAEADMLRSAAVEGRLATRGEADKFEGGYREIVKGFNDTLDAVVGPLNVAADYVDKISKGEIPEKITDEYNGDFGEIKDDLNRCIDSLDAMRQDVRFMAIAALEGRLDARADASKHQGVYMKIVQGFNDTMNSVVGPLNVAAGYIDQISKGTIPEVITDEYKGDFNAIKDNLNKCIEALDAMRQDVRFMAVAALEGRLDARADSSKHQGVYMKIVQGFNDTLDAVTNPINEAAGVLEQLASNDLTARVQGDYHGDHAKIKDSLNTAMNTLQAAITQVEMTSAKVASSAQSLSSTSGEVGKSSQQVAETIGQVAAGSQEQSRTVQSSATAMEQLTRAIQEIAVGAQSQAKTVEGTVAMVQQSASAVEEVAKLSQDASESGRQVAEIATAGGQQVEDAVGSMGKIKEATDQVAEMVKHLGESSQQIGAIVETIDDIAEQTNLLALNAAIEAARAGEHGKGFAVVADEVRKLAERSSKATGEIAELITSIQNMTSQAVEAMDRGSRQVEEGAELGNQAGAALERIQSAIGGIVNQIENMSAAAQQMAASSSEVIKAIENVSAITEQTTAAAEEMSASSTEVVQQIEQVAAVSEENAAAAQEVSATTEEQNAAVKEMTAASEELAMMAGGLQELVAQFKIDDGANMSLRMTTGGQSDRDIRKAA